jgi:hypothetical protein
MLNNITQNPLSVGTVYGSQSLEGSDEMLRFLKSRSKRHPRTVLTRSRILGDLQEVVSTPDAPPFFMVIFR